MQEHTVLKPADDVSHQEMSPDGETVILSLSSGTLFTCNETTRAFLESLDGQKTFAQVIDELHAQYDVDRGELREDIARIADEMVAMKLLCTV